MWSTFLNTIRGLFSVHYSFDVIYTKTENILQSFFTNIHPVPNELYYKHYE